jgi:prevent-host-death family protein
MWLDSTDTKRHTGFVEVGVRELRDHLSRYLSAVQSGDEITVTEHGRAVARLVPIDLPRPLDRLVAEGLVTPATSAKTRRTGKRVKAKGLVSDLVAEQRQ